MEVTLYNDVDIVIEVEGKKFIFEPFMQTTVGRFKLDLQRFLNGAMVQPSGKVRLVNESEYVRMHIDLMESYPIIVIDDPYIVSDEELEKLYSLLK